jgi:steroid delta-isomerase-like uncharacterized protein
MTRDDTIKLFEREQQHWQARDAEALAGRHSRDGVIVSPLFRTVTGIDAIRESYRSLFTMFPDWRYTGQQTLVDGDHVTLRFIVQATHAGEFLGIPGSGRQFEIEGVRLLELKDGLIQHEWRCYDFTRFLAELGVIRIKMARPGS